MNKLIKGIVACIIINIMLKEIVKEERPDPEKDCFDRYGMPSGHSQLAWFLALYFADMDNISWSATIFSLSTLISYNRVNIGCHTIKQVVTGAIIGSMLGILVKKIR